MSRFTKKISSQELAEDCTLLSETVLVDGQEMIYDGVDEEGHNFLLFDPLFESTDRHDIMNYTPVVIGYDEAEDHTFTVAYEDDE